MESTGKDVIELNSDIKRSVYRWYADQYDINDLSNYTAYLLANYCMPTLLKLKPSSLFRVSRRLISDQQSFLRLLENEINTFHSAYSILYEDESMMIILVYNETLLREVISGPEEQSFLYSMGYSFNGDTMQNILTTLTYRYYEFIRSRSSHCIHPYPHEIGIILGYPIQDVKDFIRFNGKNYTLCGYWKVYHEEDHARRTFKKYNQLKEKALKGILSGKKLKESI